jgi:hypothetical protein
MGRPAGVDASLARARASFERREWRAAREAYAEVGPATLAVDDLERLAIAAYLTGADEQSDAAWRQAHAVALGAGDEPRAAGCAFWLGWNLMLRGDMAGSTGWLARARTLLDGATEECAVHGMLLLVEALHGLERGDLGPALAGFERAAAIGERCWPSAGWGAARCSWPGTTSCAARRSSTRRWSPSSPTR